MQGAICFLIILSETAGVCFLEYLISVDDNFYFLAPSHDEKSRREKYDFA